MACCFLALLKGRQMMCKDAQYHAALSHLDSLCQAIPPSPYHFSSQCCLHLLLDIIRQAGLILQLQCLHTCRFSSCSSGLSSSLLLCLSLQKAKQAFTASDHQSTEPMTSLLEIVVRFKLRSACLSLAEFVISLSLYLAQFLIHTPV